MLRTWLLVVALVIVTVSGAPRGSAANQKTLGLLRQLVDDLKEEIQDQTLMKKQESGEASFTDYRQGVGQFMLEHGCSQENVTNTIDAQGESQVTLEELRYAFVYVFTGVIAEHERDWDSVSEEDLIMWLEQARNNTVCYYAPMHLMLRRMYDFGLYTHENGETCGNWYERHEVHDKIPECADYEEEMWFLGEQFWMDMFHFNCILDFFEWTSEEMNEYSPHGFCWLMDGFDRLMHHIYYGFSHITETDWEECMYMEQDSGSEESDEIQKLDKGGRKDIDSSEGGRNGGQDGGRNGGQDGGRNGGQDGGRNGGQGGGRNGGQGINQRQLQMKKAITNLLGNNRMARSLEMKKK